MCVFWKGFLGLKLSLTCEEQMSQNENESKGPQAGKSCHVMKVRSWVATGGSERVAVTENLLKLLLNFALRLGVGAQQM